MYERQFEATAQFEAVNERTLVVAAAERGEEVPFREKAKQRAEENEAVSKAIGILSPPEALESAQTRL